MRLQILGSLIRIFGKKELHFLMAENDTAGKTKILYKYTFKKKVTTAPITSGYKIEPEISFIPWDTDSSKIWSHYFYDTSNSNVVIDPRDGHRNRIINADELHKIIQFQTYELRKAEILAFVNKEDFPNVMSAAELAEKFDRKWSIQQARATRGRGQHTRL